MVHETKSGIAINRRPWTVAALVTLVFAGLWILGQLTLWVSILSAAILISATFAFYWSVSDEPGDIGREPEPLRPPPRDGLVILKQLPDPVILIDDSDRIEYVNQAAIDIIGFDPISMPVTQVLRYPAVTELLSECRTGESAVSAEFQMPSPVERFIRAYASKPDGGGAVLVFHDLTTEHRTEQMRADFVANASHELRTPLASVLGFIETLRGHAKDDPEAQDKFLGVMQEQAERMGRLVDDLLSLSRIEINEHVLPDEPVDLTSVIEEVCDQLRPIAKDRGVQIITSGPPEFSTVKGDRDELIQVVQNLVDNATKYGRKGKKVEVALQSSQEDGRWVEIEVRDFGEGIDPLHIPRLTERFYRADVKDSRARGGTGLGLAIVKHIVNRHRGKLEIKSELGQGSRFVVRFPAI